MRGCKLAIERLNKWTYSSLTALPTSKREISDVLLMLCRNCVLETDADLGNKCIIIIRGQCAYKSGILNKLTCFALFI